MASTDSHGNQGNGFSESRAISADGRYVAFSSLATNLVDGDTNGVEDVFVKDMHTGKTIRITTDSEGNQSNGGSRMRDMSVDGRYITFHSTATNLVEGDTNGATDVFVKDIFTGAISIASSDSNGNQGNGESGFASISADGRYVLFYSESSNLVDGDTNGSRDVFIKDMETGEIRLASRHNDGSQAVGPEPRPISANGRYVLWNGDGGASYMTDLSKAGLQEISGMVVSNQAFARVTIDLSKQYLEELNGYKAEIGASLSRAQTFISNLQVQSENYAAASAQITDTDVAEESAQLIKKNILQQGAAAVLGRANKQPEVILQLLQNV